MNETATPETPAPVADTGSLSDHEQTFGSEFVAPAEPVPVVDAPPAETPAADDEPERDAKGRVRHRAKSQKAGPEDVPRIAELTRKLREAEAERDALRATPKAVTPPVRPAVQPPAVSAFADPEPTLEQFSSAADPYAAWMRAVNAWDRKKEAFDTKQTETKTQTEQQLQQADADFVTWAKDATAAHDVRLKALIDTDPKARAVFEAAVAANEIEFSPVMQVAIETSESGPQMLLALAQDRELVDTLLLQTANQRAFDDRHTQNPLVAVVQRRLLKAVQAVPTGSAAAPRAVTVAPRPPNPVRTAPHTPSESLPGDEASLAAHERAFNHPRRRS